MKLLIDIGNSRLKWASYAAGELSELAAMVYTEQDISNQLDAAWTGQKTAEAVFMCSVAAPWVEIAVTEWIKQHWAVPVIRLVTKKRCAGVNNGYLRPEQLGVDRWAAIVGAFQLTDQALCVIDSGTALTCDVVTKDGNHLGGLIVPGRSLQQQLLLSHTAGVNVEQKLDEFLMWGRETTSCVESGILQSQLALIERCIRQLQDSEAEPVSVIITGGDAEALLPYLPPPVRFVPDLVFQGMTYMLMERGG